MARVMVRNLNQFDHTEKFRGEMITIKAGEAIEMEREDGVLFKSQFYQPKFDKGGLQMPESYKMIRLEPIESKVPDVAGQSDHVCMACGFTSQTAAGLKSHIRHNHAGQMLDDKAREDLTNEG